ICRLSRWYAEKQYVLPGGKNTLAETDGKYFRQPRPARKNNSRRIHLARMPYDPLLKRDAMLDQVAHKRLHGAASHQCSGFRFIQPPLVVLKTEMRIPAAQLGWVQPFEGNARLGKDTSRSDRVWSFTGGDPNSAAGNQDVIAQVAPIRHRLPGPAC